MEAVFNFFKLFKSYPRVMIGASLYLVTLVALLVFYFANGIVVV